MSLTSRILIGMLAGVLFGFLVQWSGVASDHWVRAFLVDGLLDAGGQIFMRSLQLLVVPLVFISLVFGSSELGSSGNMGRVAGKTVGLYLLTTALAIGLALSVASVINPGKGLSDDKGASGLAGSADYVVKAPEPVKDTLINIFPTNPVAAMADGNMLQIILFALLLGVAISKTGNAGLKVKGIFSDLNAVMMKLITLLIELAPIGVFCLMGRLFTGLGWEEIAKLILYFGTVVVVLALHAGLTYPILLTFLAKLNPIIFFRKLREAILVAFSTSSSGATIPVTLRTVKEKIGISNEVSSFVIPLGATINMDGTAIMQGVATVFVAQLYGIDLGAADYLMVILTATLASIGTAGVPGVGLIMLVMVFNQVGLPVEGIMFIIGVDRLLDMMRTAVNVAGDATVASVVAHTEGELDRTTFNNKVAS